MKTILNKFWINITLIGLHCIDLLEVIICLIIYVINISILEILYRWVDKLIVYISIIYLIIRYHSSVMTFLTCLALLLCLMILKFQVIIINILFQQIASSLNLVSITFILSFLFTINK